MERCEQCGELTRGNEPCGECGHDSVEWRQDDYLFYTEDPNHSTITEEINYD